MPNKLTPLWVFMGGQVVALLAFLFLGALGNAVQDLATETAPIASNFWNWTWVTNPDVVKFIVFLMIELLTLYAAARAFLKVR